MKLREQIDIDARPQDIWPWLADPVRMDQWHAKIVAVDRQARGAVSEGERFAMTYRMSGREHTMNVEVVRCAPSAELALRHHLTDSGKARSVDEQFRLDYDGAMTRVRQAVDLSNAGIPWVLRPLIWFISKFGQPRGEGILEPLKRIVESGGGE